MHHFVLDKYMYQVKNDKLSKQEVFILILLCFIFLILMIIQPTILTRGVILQVIVLCQLIKNFINFQRKDVSLTGFLIDRSA